MLVVVLYPTVRRLTKTQRIVSHLLIYVYLGGKEYGFDENFDILVLAGG